MAYLVQSSPVENTKLLYYQTKVAGSRNLNKWSTKLDQHWIGLTSVNRDNIGVTLALTDTNFIGSDQHLLAHCMFSIDGAKQDKQNGMDQHWIDEQMDAVQSFNIKHGNSQYTAQGFIKNI